VTVFPSDELTELFTRREELLLEQEARNREQLAETLAIQLGELSAATRESAISIAEEMGLSLETLVSDLGISLDDLTSETTRQLSDVARTLNLSVAELADAVGVSLGELTETNSLLNDAFEAEIASLPGDIQDQLKPLLEGVESAVTDADSNAAIDMLRNAVDQLAPELRDELAPYLGLDAAFQDPIESLADVFAEQSSQQLSVLQNIESILASIADANGVNDFEVPSATANLTTNAGAFVPPIETEAVVSGNSNARIEDLLNNLITAVNSNGQKQVSALNNAANKNSNYRGI